MAVLGRSLASVSISLFTSSILSPHPPPRRFFSAACCGALRFSWLLRKEAHSVLCCCCKAGDSTKFYRGTLIIDFPSFSIRSLIVPRNIYEVYVNMYVCVSRITNDTTCIHRWVLGAACQTISAKLLYSSEIQFSIVEWIIAVGIFDFVKLHLA